MQTPPRISLQVIPPPGPQQDDHLHGTPASEPPSGEPLQWDPYFGTRLNHPCRGLHPRDPLQGILTGDPLLATRSRETPSWRTTPVGSRSMNPRVAILGTPSMDILPWDHSSVPLQCKLSSETTSRGSPVGGPWCSPTGGVCFEGAPRRVSNGEVRWTGPPGGIILEEVQ
jgi:hypothetical protein